MTLTTERIRAFAETYTEAWCSRSGERVASCFTEDASSIINKGEATRGRPAIAAAMGAFFDEFPDLVLSMDALRSGANQAIYLWTLEGTHSETGNRVCVTGWQNWILSDEPLILEADGGYDAEDYERQVNGA